LSLSHAYILKSDIRKL